MPDPNSVMYRLFRGDLAIIFYLSTVRLLLHLATNFFTTYDFAYDELYFLSCSNHLSAGYVDHPPFSIYVLKAVTTFFGDSLFAVRLVPSFTGALTVFFTGLITKELGGNKFAQFLACLCALLSIVSLSMNNYFSMNSLEILLYAMISYQMLRIINGAAKKAWITLGILLGVGLLNKLSMLFLGAGIFTGLLFTEQRKWFYTKWPYLAASIAFAIWTPFIIWNFINDFAHLEFLTNAGKIRADFYNRDYFITEQFKGNNVFAAPVWVGGLIALGFFPNLKRYRALTFLYLVPLLAFIIEGAPRADYLTPAYSILWAAGGVIFARISIGRLLTPVFRVSLCTLILLSALPALPYALPMLPPEDFVRYANTDPANAGKTRVGDITSFLGDMLGWKEQVKEIAAVYNALPENEKEKCAIYSDNYGRCGAIDLYGKQYGLPPSIGNLNNFWLWGHRNYTGEIMLIVDDPDKDNTAFFEKCTLSKTITCHHCSEGEDSVKIYLCYKLKSPLKDVWPLLKTYN